MQAQREPGTRGSGYFPPRASGEGGPPKAVGGARDSTLLLQRNRSVESEAPSTTLLRRVVPLPRFRGGGCNTIPVSRRTPAASDVKQRILFASPAFGIGEPSIQSGPLRAVAEQLFAARFRQIK
jgi:hypothetical protein